MSWRYLALQVPGWVFVTVIAVWLGAVGLPAWAAVVIVAVFIVKDIVVDRIVRSTFETAPRPIYPIGALGTAVEALRPRGIVRVNGELWDAISRGRPVDAGGAVVVRAASGLTLSVEPAETEPPERPQVSAYHADPPPRPPAPPGPRPPLPPGPPPPPGPPEPPRRTKITG